MAAVYSSICGCIGPGKNDKGSASNCCSLTESGNNCCIPGGQADQGSKSNCCSGKAGAHGYCQS